MQLREMTMMRTAPRCVAFLAILLTAIMSQAEARRFTEIPLPNDVRVEQPAEGMPQEIAVFYGAWEGKWGGSLPSIVIITHINSSTDEVEGIYGWGKRRSFDAGSTSFTGEIGLGGRGNKVLRFTLSNGAQVSFRVPKRDDTLLKRKYKLGDGRRPSVGFFSRTELGTEPAHTGTARAETPEAYSAFLGEWCGQWHPGPPNRLIVKVVTEEGGATGIYSWVSGNRRFEGKITNGELRFAFDNMGAKVTYRLAGDGTLAGTWKTARGTSKITSKRCP